MKCELVEFQTTDKLMLPGLLYEPAQKTKKAVIFLHGMSSSIFYQVARTNVLGQEITKQGISFLSFNNRGSNYIQDIKTYKRGKRTYTEAGMTFERIKDCIKDIDAAINFLINLNYTELYLVGHSTGANKICVYNFYKPRNQIIKYVLLGGGDDTGLGYQSLGEKDFYKTLKKAKAKIQKDQGRELAPKKLMDMWLSWKSVYDILNPDGDYNSFPFNEYMNYLKLSKKPLFRHYKSIKKPTLVIYGGDDEYCYGNVSECVEILRQETSVPGRFTFKIIKNADHGFHGKEQQLAKEIVEWLK